VLSFRAFGINEWAFRLPSALAGTATCVMLYRFIVRQSKNRLLAFMALIILVSSFGFVKYHHSVRTGDYDSLLCLLSTAYAISFFRFVEEDKAGHLLLSFGCLTLAVLTKGVAGLFFLPGLLIYALYRRSLPRLFQSPAFYTGVLAFILVAGGYYWLREQHTPGYLRAVMGNELGGRMFTRLDNTEKRAAAPFYYYDLITDTNFRFWYLFLPFGMVLGWYAQDKVLRKMAVWSASICAVLFAVISLAGNKHDWYDMPMYPLLALLAALGIFMLTQMLLRLPVREGVLRKNALPYVFLVIGAAAYLHILAQSLRPDPGEWIVENTSVCRYLKAIYHGGEPPPQGGQMVIAMDGEYQANVEWYASVLRRKGVATALISADSLQPSPFVIVYKQRLVPQIEADWDCVLKRSLLHDHVRIYALTARKPHAAP
jgi:4-amino-4-deoxy-L-arabinose transferase-like glycosyltransferase